MKCTYYAKKHCLSCDLLAHDYATSIQMKEKKLGLLFEALGGCVLPSVLCEPGADGSRNKAKLAVALVNNEIRFGFYNQAMQWTSLEHCPLHVAAINDLLPTMQAQFKRHHLLPYDVHTKKGELKYVLITYSESTDELLLRLVLRSKPSLTSLKPLSESIMHLHPRVKVVTVNIQPTHQAILEGEEEIVLTQDDSIAHQFGPYTLFQGPRSFFQTNTRMALALYEHFQQHLQTRSIKNMLDLYCGVGAFSFFASHYCETVHGVEISKEAIHYANKARDFNHSHGVEISKEAIHYANKARDFNHSHGVQFTAMDAELFLKSQNENAFDAVMVNPPRRGLNADIVHQLLRLAPKHLFYSSCNAETLARDTAMLAAQYEVQSLQLFDMFPFTSHFETLVVFTKQ